MDADLEAILAESDSDDAGGEGGLSLEDILKEDNDQSSPLQEYRAPQTNEESYSARDWAVLQQILREDDDDDDVVEPPPPIESPLQKHQEKPQAAPVGPVLWRGERLAPFALRERRLVAQNESIEASPLETKRRNRSKPTDLSRGSTTSSEQKPSGALKIDTLKTASRQLAANARRPELGPGAPAALGASSKFVALGTSRGLALVFDHFQEVRRVLGTASTDPVKCVALEDDVACLGHASGVLVLWDVVKGSQLRRVDDAFSVSVEKVAFCCRGASDRAVAAIDASGVVNRIVFRQRVLGGSYLHEVECLLDAKSNVTPWLSVSSTYAAFSSTTASFVVAFSPSVRVAVTWPRPSSQEESNAVVAISDDGVLIRAWGTDLDALNSIEEGAAVDFVPCQLPANAVALCVVARGVIILGSDDVLRLIDRKGRQLDAVSFHADMIASSIDTVYALQGNELLQIEARSAQQRIASLVDAGEWLEALSSQVDAVSDDPSETNNAIDLLRRYVALAVANAPARRAATRQLDLARSHFKMLASVCVEFCIAVSDSASFPNVSELQVCVDGVDATPRHRSAVDVAVDILDVLFDDVYHAFQKASRSDVYLDLLEPYILTDKLKRLAPEVLQAFVQRFRENGKLVNVERCMLHLDPTALDFNMLTRLLKTHRLHSATYRIYVEGLGDFVAPLEIALDACHEGIDVRHRGGQALLYARYCLEGLAFPSGTAVEPTTSVLWFLLRKKRPGSDQEYPHLSLLFTVDAQASLDLLSAHLIKRTSCDDTVVVNPYDNVQASSVTPPSMDPPSSYFIDGPQAACDASTKKLFLAYVAAHAARGVLVPSQALGEEVLRHLALEGRTDDVDASVDDLDAWASLPKCLRVLQPENVATLQKEASAKGRSEASIILLEYEAARLLDALASEKSLETRQRASEAVAATIQASLAHADLDVKKRAFTFITTSVSSFLEKARRLDTTVAASIRDALPSLAAVDASATAKVISNVLPDDVAGACQALAAKPALQFVVLDELIKTSDVQVDDEERAVYVELLCDSAPHRVHAYLASHDGYDVDQTLELCRRHRIDDATALLLEEKGDAPGALDLILKGLGKRFEVLRDAARSKLAVDEAEADLRASVAAATRLCSRRSEDHESRRAWFSTLDALLEAQRSLKLSRELPSTASQVRSVARDLARSYLTAAADRVPLRDVVSKLFKDHPDATLGDFRDVLTSALAMSRVDAALYDAASKCQEQDQFSRRQKDAFFANRPRHVTHLDGRELRPLTEDDPPSLHNHLALMGTAPDAELILTPFDPKDPLGPWQATSFLPEDEESVTKREEFLRKLRASNIEGAWTKVKNPGYYNKYMDCEDDPAARMRLFAEEDPYKVQVLEKERVPLPPRAPPGSLDAVAKFSASLPKGLIDGTLSSESDEEDESPFTAYVKRAAKSGE